MLPVSRQIIFGISVIVLFISVMFFARPVFAQSVGQVIETLKEKMGFGYDPDFSEYIFSKDTPNYRAFAGTISPAGGHRIVLERDGSSLGLSFISADVAGQDTSYVLGDIAPLTEKDQLILDIAEDLLLVQASVSSQGRVPPPPEYQLTDGEREMVASAAAILGLATEGDASASVESVRFAELSQEAQDFSLLLALKSNKIKRLSLDVDLQLADISRDMSSIMSQAKLVEEPAERIVLFTNIAMGMDLVYRLNEAGIRQQIVLNDSKKIYDTYLFKIEKTALIPEEKKSGVWYFRSLGNEPLLRIPKSWATDASGKFTNNVNISVSHMKDVGEVLTVTVASEWLTAPERLFPVTIHTALEVVPEKREGHPQYILPRHSKPEVGELDGMRSIIPGTATSDKSSDSAVFNLPQSPIEPSLPDVTPSSAIVPELTPVDVPAESASNEGERSVDAL